MKDTLRRSRWLLAAILTPVFCLGTLLAQSPPPSTPAKPLPAIIQAAQKSYTIETMVEFKRRLDETAGDLNQMTDEKGHTALFDAVRAHNDDMALLLLLRGANPNKADDGLNVVMRGVWHQPTKPLMQLIARGADLNARDPQGRTVLTRAIADGNLETADYLRQNGAHE
jgi:hypothetical protein